MGRVLVKCNNLRLEYKASFNMNSHEKYQISAVTEIFEQNVFTLKIHVCQEVQ